MRIGVLLEPSPNAYYRAILPLQAMEKRGHDIVWPDNQGSRSARELSHYDVVHIYRRAAENTQKVARELTRRGIPIVYDNDDDFTVVPKESPNYKTYGGAAGQRIFAMTVTLARMARRFTTTTAVLADRYRAAGVDHGVVIGNYLPPRATRRRVRHDGLLIGWVAGMEHRVDLVRINIVDALEQVLLRHSHVRVESIGVDLALSQRYHFVPQVPFYDLPRHIAAFDIGLAPLADLPHNLARSDIKLKEYAACGVPWLASPVGPYAALNEAEGGRIVPDDGWFTAIDDLVKRRWMRWRLSRQGRAWASRQTIGAAGDQWEQVFREACR